MTNQLVGIIILFGAIVARSTFERGVENLEQFKPTFLKFVSIIQRNTQKYYDSILEEYHIGGGQQFFLIRIHENNGISMYDLAKLGHFDKGTVTKAVRKLEELGYVTVQTDETDRRIRRLYVTKAAEHVIKQIYAVRERWKEALVAGLPIEEDVFYEILKNMAEIACGIIEKKAEEKREAQIEP